MPTRRFRRAFLTASLFAISALGAGLSVPQTAYAAPPPEAFGQLPKVYDAAISPDGKQIAVFINIKGKWIIRLMTIGANGEPLRMIGLGEGVKPSYLKWVNNERVIASFWQSQKLGGTPITTGYLYTMDAKTLDGKILVKPPRGVVRQFNNQVVDWLENDPDHILMQYSDESYGTNPDVKKVNVATGKASVIRKWKHGVEYWNADQSGTPRIGTGRNSENGPLRRRVFDNTTQKWEDVEDYPGLSPQTPIFSIVGSSNDFVIGDYGDKDTLGLYVYNLDAKRITRKLFHNEDYDVDGVILNKDGTEIIGAKYVSDSSERELIDDRKLTISKVQAQVPGYTIDYVDQTQDGDILLIKISSPYDPGGLYKFDANDGSLIRYSGLYEGIEAEDLGEVISVRYTSRDGAKIPAFVTLPATVSDTSQIKNLPAIILPHGGPYARDEKRFDYFAQFFASRGYLVLQMNFRGSDGYGKSFSDAGRNNWVVMQEDVEDGAKFLLRKGYADPKRMCIAGWSYGGYAALMGAAKNSDLYSCAISMAGLTDIADAKRDLRKYRGGRQAAKDFFGETFNDPDVRKANTPTKVADQIKIPVFLAHGELDQRVHYDQFKRMRSALKKARVDATYMTFDDEDHFLSNQDNRQKFFKGLDKFLTKINGRSEHMAP